MNSKHDPKYKELHRAADEVLHYIWDPIGISNIPQARDEYHGYLPHVLGLLQSGGTQEQIASYLSNIISTRMELSENSAHDLEVAELLVNWREYIDDKFA
ncbi:hypothetical protein V9K20_003402 [Vibrio cholerae]|uniref:hypothetical protein n=1 Tax=Vibrio cholerae TaxID=666 RepID=UPI0015813FA1|nr:hypothetical protein [Vibrio cholerae]EGR0594009.1 hypothetical protein [Vibrio cholerae]ELH5152265.1 hypothetical protein [Vibrio cholerae]QKU90973.1 hypothetical protein HPY16_15135 [Vibrio cholerae]HEJ2455499.1 hypothetical protein [Vibrio cholerae]